MIDPFNTSEGEEVDGLLIAHAVATRPANTVATGYHQPTMWSVAAGYAQRPGGMSSHAPASVRTRSCG
jgi:hypothetical protein